MKFNEHCPVCDVKVGASLSLVIIEAQSCLGHIDGGCNNCGAKGDRMVQKFGKWCKICSVDYNKDSNKLDVVICIHNRNFEVLDKNGAYIYEFH